MVVVKEMFVQYNIFFLQTTKYRGPLSLSNLLAINVYVYSKISEERLPNLKKISAVIPNIEQINAQSNPSQNVNEILRNLDEGEGGVKMDRIYRSTDVYIYYYRILIQKYLKKKE